MGFSAIPILTSIFNLVLLALSSTKELQESLRFGLQHHDYPMSIRIPIRTPQPEQGATQNVIDIIIHSWNMSQEGTPVAIIGVDNFYHRTLALAKAMKATYTITSTVLRPLLITELDTHLLNRLQES